MAKSPAYDAVLSQGIGRCGGFGTAGLGGLYDAGLHRENQRGSSRDTARKRRTHIPDPRNVSARGLASQAGSYRTDFAV